MSAPPPKRRRLTTVRVQARVNLELSGRYGRACQNLNLARKRIEALEAELQEHQGKKQE